MPKTLCDAPREMPAEDQAQQRWGNKGKLSQDQVVRPLGVQPEEKRPKNRGVNIHFPMQKVLKISPRISSSIRRADDFARRVERFTQRHRDQFGIDAFPELLLGFLQAGAGALKACLMTRVDGREHRRLGGLISTRLGNDRSRRVRSIPSPVRQEIAAEQEFATPVDCKPHDQRDRSCSLRESHRSMPFEA